MSDMTSSANLIITSVNLILITILIGLIVSSIRWRQLNKQKFTEDTPKVNQPNVPLTGRFTRHDTGPIYTDSHGNQMYAYIFDGEITYVLFKPNGDQVAYFTMHNGSMAGGLRGMFNEHVLAAISHRVDLLNEKVPCSQNRLALKCIAEALQYLEARTKLRQQNKE